MIVTTNERTNGPATGTATPDDTQASATTLSSALTAGSRAYVTGVFELGRMLGGFGREIANEAGQHVRATVEARALRDVAELQAVWLQHRIETSTAHVKEFADLAHSRTMEVIAPFAALLRRNKAA
jgi:hypothetical protein